MAPCRITVTKMKKYVLTLKKRFLVLKSMYNFSFFSEKIPLDIFLNAWSTSLFQF